MDIQNPSFCTLSFSTKWCLIAVVEIQEGSEHHEQIGGENLRSNSMHALFLSKTFMPFGPFIKRSAILRWSEKCNSSLLNWQPIEPFLHTKYSSPKIS